MDDQKPTILTAEIEKVLSFQSYEPSQKIEGVTLRPLRKHRAENGWFVEILRLTNGTVDGLNDSDPPTVRQLSAALASPGRINAFHLHPKRSQSELWTVISGALVVWMVDCRAESSTKRVKQRVILSGEEPSLLQIPAGVAHGYRATGEDALLLYAADQQFDPVDPDEGRLPWDYFGAELWEEDRG